MYKKISDIGILQKCPIVLSHWDPVNKKQVEVILEFRFQTATDLLYELEKVNYANIFRKQTILWVIKLLGTELKCFILGHHKPGPKSGNTFEKP